MIRGVNGEWIDDTNLTGYQKQCIARRRRDRDRENYNANGLYSDLFALLFTPTTYLIRHGYGKHLLFLWLLGLPLLLSGWALAEVVLHVHADPSLFLAGWQAHFARHPDQANWAWVVKDFVDLCRW
jgi:hypothetical protein